MEIPHDFDGQQQLLLAAETIMTWAAQRQSEESVAYADDGNMSESYLRARLAVENWEVAHRLNAVAMTYDLPLFEG